jgi:hypothetical protein
MKIKIIVVIIFLFLFVSFFFTLNFFFGKKEKVEIIEEKEEIKEEIPEVKIIDIDSTTRPIGVMINNHDVARPYHSGLQEAYLTYEIIVEGGITRLFALYKDVSVDRIGSVRSLRDYFIDYALENDAYLIHFGGSPEALENVQTLKINNINFMTNNSYFRDKTLNIPSEHTAFSSIERMSLALEKKKYRSTLDGGNLLTYSPRPLIMPENKIDAKTINLEYSSSSKPSYIYNEITKTYDRSYNGVIHKDYITKKQYNYKNIIVYYIDHTVLDAKGRKEIYNFGTGTGYYITNGYAVPINWSKKDRASKTIYTDLNGESLIVNDGNTIIHLVPEGKMMDIK